MAVSSEGAAERRLPEVMISVDDHIIEPKDVWQARLPAHLKAIGPKVVETANGDAWEIDGERRRVVGIAASANRDPTRRFSTQSVRYADIMPGAYDAKARLKDMDDDGVAAQIVYNNLPGFAGATFFELAQRNAELAYACVTAYNDWLATDWCAVAPDRLIGQCIIPLWDLEAAAKEAARAFRLGHKALLLPGNPESMGLPSFEDAAWDGVFSECQNAGAPVAMHIAGSNTRQMRAKMGDQNRMCEVGATRLATPFSNAEAMTRIIFAGVLHRFPTLKVVSAEAGIGWIPFTVEKMDDTYFKQRVFEKMDLPEPPSVYFNRQCYASFILDDAGMEMRHQIGLDRILWSTDYPHADSTFPKTQETLLAHYGHIPLPELQQVMCDNALKVFNLQMPNFTKTTARQTEAA